jgi:hypothetical protein
MEIDMNMIMLIMVGMFVWSVAGKWILEFLGFLDKRTKRIVSKQTDLHGAIYKRNKLPAKANMRGSRLKRLVATGDEDVRPMDWATVKGIIWGRDVVQVYFKFRKVSPWRWAIIPKELVDDSLGVNLRVRCAGFRAKGNFYVPICLSSEDAELVKKCEKIVNSWESYIIDDEMAVEIKEQYVDSTIEAIGVRNPAERIRDREDTLQGTQQNMPTQSPDSEGVA